ncbi:MAG: U32 family peptidase [Deltaproteobacteria bacterium]|nr:U32 family peptidase [Deltaproteobacteria bacterium]
MRRRPELLAPAGDASSLRAALAMGADAVYFGLGDGFNARARAENFSLGTLRDTMSLVHRAGARGYLTLNTLIFEQELEHVERIIVQVAEAGVDAILVQDPAVALLAREICPDLEVHASTQMTVSSAEGARFARGLGAKRVVVPRELSVAEIRRLAAETDLELEVFIHGALCVSWSGQCLTSEAWGGRSANRGQCAQSCRMPYDVIVDGEPRDLGDVKYLLSPKDLAGAAAVPELVEIGVSGLKIEGRLKGPQYVATAVKGYRAWLDSVVAGHRNAGQLADDLQAMSLSFSRGFSDGFLAGSDHQELVEGRFPKHRGLFLGWVKGVDGNEVRVETGPTGRPWTGALAQGGTRSPGPTGQRSSPLSFKAPALPLEPRPGMGVVFDDGHPEDRDEPGGPIFGVERRRNGWILAFGRQGPDLSRIRPGQRVWVTSDPSLSRSVDSLRTWEPAGRHQVDLDVSGKEGEPLSVRARSGRHEAYARSRAPLALAQGEGLVPAILAEKLGALGGTPFTLGVLNAEGLAKGLHVPVSELKALRRQLVSSLSERVSEGPRRHVRKEPVLERLRADSKHPVERGGLRGVPSYRDAEQPQLLPLCRSDEQLDVVIELGLPEVELDWMEMTGLSRAVERARRAGLRVTIATTRVHKPGEEGYDTRVAHLSPDAVLVRNWGTLIHFLELPEAAERPILHGDFSLNVTNSLTAAHLLRLGLSTLTCSHDLDETQLMGLLDHAPSARVTIPLHHHIPTFHTEHCVYAHLLSSGRDFRSCGRPCEGHQVAIRDRIGLVHPVLVDVGCRNTVYNAQAQSAASLVPKLLDRGVKRFRVELVRESRAETARVLGTYLDLLKGRVSPAQAVRQAGVHEQFGVTQGTMRVLGMQPGRNAAP